MASLCLMTALWVLRRPLLPIHSCAVRGFSSEACEKRSYTPRRALTYVPGNDERKLMKIPSLNADCIVMDCEDGVALNRKDDARHMIVRMLKELEFGRSEPCVRVNSMSSGLTADDLNVVMKAETLPPTLLLPKVQSPQELDAFAAQLNASVGHLGSLPKDKKFNLIIYMETAVGLMNLVETCKRGHALCSEGADFVLDGIVFGSDDFCADIGASRTADAKELMYARQHMVTIAKAFSLHAIDLVHIDYKDLDALRKQSVEGARMGYTGKQVIHPSQIPVVQDAFKPSPERVEWATEMIRAFEEHQNSGKGAFTFRGSMIDMPSVLQARNIVEFTDAIGDS
ncbi:hypothetical protein CAPTEDRAFT_220156 [Capitella teleta]|uniref:Citramalyl-CoA lyase, mitochondrial n=1 Tax=Capitella teleta TaxID=283909 RepID=R7VL42_CAPTE|nr:hypothetical protein CAPTEDRAFT_220156 [Capitella teleta]|eukprot:ELU17285.1 hypothetical protein CAPTEDRAFT_220156 [Capitella teleta]